MAARIQSVIDIISNHSSIPRLKSIEGVVGIRPGFSSDPAENFQPCIVLLTAPGIHLKNIPVEIEGIKVEQRTASVLEMNGLLSLSDWMGVQLEVAPQINYVPPPDTLVKLETMKVSNITCHVGPDSGWKTLKPFLEDTTRSLTVAMYEFYAPHIVEMIKQKGASGSPNLDMILQVSGNDNEIKEALEQSWGTRLNFVEASVSGPNRIFNNSYHTKVAVRDSNTLWLSSGNWSPNSQPLIPPGSEQDLFKAGNREWHVIIEDKALAEMYEKFIKYDMDQARTAVIPESAPVFPDLLVPDSILEAELAFKQPRPFEAKKFATGNSKITVKPLMSPDNYAIEVLKLIQNAKVSLYLQFSYIRQPSQEIFDQIIDAIAQKMRDGLDVRVLVSNNQNPEHSDFLIGQRGWNRNMFRRQTSKMHNKGILIDGKIAAVGSNNWSTDGTQYNRDTTLVFFSTAIAKYFTEVFLFDWNNLSKPIGSRPEITPIIAPKTGTTPLGMKRIPWQAWFDE